MAKNQTRKTKTSGVSFEPGVQEYLKQLSLQDERTVSYILNKLVKRHAQENGVDLQQFLRSEHQTA